MKAQTVRAAGIKGCRPALTGHCPDCKRVCQWKHSHHLFSRIPHPIYKFMSQMRMSEWALLTYLISQVPFDADDPDFGTVTISYNKITEGTGLQRPGRQFKRLVKLGLVKLTQKKFKEGTEFKVSNTVELPWYPILFSSKETERKHPDDLVKSWDDIKKRKTLHSEIIKAIDYYFQCYKEKHGKQHEMRLSQSQWRVFTQNVLKDANNQVMDLEAYIDGCDAYFGATFDIDPDYNTSHFISKKNKKRFFK